jgi:hypothetical protein
MARETAAIRELNDRRKLVWTRRWPVLCGRRDVSRALQRSLATVPPSVSGVFGAEREVRARHCPHLILRHAPTCVHTVAHWPNKHAVLPLARGSTHQDTVQRFDL